MELVNVPEGCHLHSCSLENLTIHSGSKSWTYLRLTSHCILCLIDQFCLFFSESSNAEGLQSWPSELRRSGSHYARGADQHSTSHQSLIPIPKTHFHSFIWPAFPYRPIPLKHQPCVWGCWLVLCQYQGNNLACWQPSSPLRGVELLKMNCFYIGIWWSSYTWLLLYTMFTTNLTISHNPRTHYEEYLRGSKG
jgi:hypothetical protein